MPLDVNPAVIFFPANLENLEYLEYLENLEKKKNPE